MNKVEFSIYCSAFNITNGLFDWKNSLDKFSNWAEEVVVGTTAMSDDDSINILREYAKTKSNVIIAATDFSLNNPEFDGKIKNAALQQTTKEAKILLDLDEFIPLSQKPIWIEYFYGLDRFKLDGWLIPSINLCGDINHYKDIGQKFYLHKSGLNRGVWKEAKNSDNSIDISMSDTTELITNSGDLAKCAMLEKDINILKAGFHPYVFHKWAVDIDNRIKQNQFWLPVWENRAKREVMDIILHKEEIDKIEVFEHKLPLE